MPTPFLAACPKESCMADTPGWKSAHEHLVLATISGKMRKRWVRLTAGDRVEMEMSPYDLDKARIVWRLK